MSKNYDENNATALNEKKDNGTAKTVIASSLGAFAGYEATAANLEPATCNIYQSELSGDGSRTVDSSENVITIVGHQTLEGEDGSIMETTLAVDSENHRITLMDVNNDGEADYQFVDVNNDLEFTEEEALNVQGMGLSISDPSTELISQNIDMLSHDVDLPDYYNEADVSVMI